MRSDLRLAVPALLVLSSCSNPQSFIVLDLQTPMSVSTPITGVRSVEVRVSKGTTVLSTLTYPVPAVSPDAGTTITIHHQPPPDAGLPPVSVTDLSVSFDGDVSGNVTFDVDVVNDQDCVVGRGTTVTEIKKGAIAYAIVYLDARLECRGDGGGGGGSDGSSDGGLPGCDPTNPSSTTAGLTCTATQTCQINCNPTPAGTPPRNECTMGGSGGPGTACPMMNRDCRPGTQCFNYGTTAMPLCNVQFCLQFCNSNADCAAFGAGGGGPGSFCEGPVVCGQTTLSYRTCTFNCDPRAAAVATRGGCPVGLSCVASNINDQVDCTCTAYKTVQEGGTCTSSADCVAGLLCNQMGTTRTCRSICRCDRSTADPNLCGAPNDCPVSGTTCRPVTNNMIYGVCLP